MNMSVRSDARYAIACVTSLEVRITPEDRMAVQNSQRFMMQATSAETNVLNVASSLGKECLAMTKFVEGSPVAAFIKSQLRARNIAYTGKEVPQGGPWGYRHQFNIADSGFGLRAPRVWNDRAGEIGRTLTADDFDLEKIFGQDGIGILHLSGLIAAMSPETTECCLKVAEAAKAHGTLISFDLNYRATFWKGREEELREAFHRIAQAADILVGLLGKIESFGDDLHFFPMLARQICVKQFLKRLIYLLFFQLLFCLRFLVHCYFSMNGYKIIEKLQYLLLEI